MMRIRMVESTYPNKNDLIDKLGWRLLSPSVLVSLNSKYVAGVWEVNENATTDEIVAALVYIQLSKPTIWEAYVFTERYRLAAVRAALINAGYKDVK